MTKVEVNEPQKNASEEKISLFTEALDNKKAIDFLALLGRKPETEPEQKLEFLYNSIHASMREAVRRRKKNRTPAFFFRMITTFLSAVVTILLGIKISSDLISPEWTNNIALVISAFMTFILAVSNFTDNYALWVLFTAASEKYRVLVKEIEYYAAGNENIEMVRVTELKDSYEEILKYISDRITELREEDTKN